MLPLVDRVARHTDELAIVCRRDPQAPALRNDALCSKADFCRISFGNLGATSLPTRRSRRATSDLSSEAWRFSSAISLRNWADAFRNPCVWLRISLRASRVISCLNVTAIFGIFLFLFCWCSGNTTTISIIARPHDYVCSDRQPERQCVEGKHQRDDVGIVARHCSASCRRRSIAERWKIQSARKRPLIRAMRQVLERSWPFRPDALGGSRYVFDSSRGIPAC